MAPATVIIAAAKWMTRMLYVATLYRERGADSGASGAHTIASVPFRTINPPRRVILLLDADQTNDRRPSSPPLPFLLPPLRRVRPRMAEAEQRGISYLFRRPRSLASSMPLFLFPSSFVNASYYEQAYKFSCQLWDIFLMSCVNFAFSQLFTACLTQPSVAQIMVAFIRSLLPTHPANSVLPFTFSPLLPAYRIA